MSVRIALEWASFSRTIQLYEQQPSEAGVIRPSPEEFESLAARGNLIPVVREILADHDTPLSLFRRLDDGRTSFLLESVEGGEKWARYSFIGSGARASFRAKDGVVEWIDVFGYAVPLTWGDPGAEYHAVRNSAAAMEFSMLLKYDVVGADATEVVDRIFSRDVSNMNPGSIAYGVVVDEDGKMVDDCTVFVHGPEHLRVFGGNPQVGEYLEKQDAPEADVTQRRDELAQLSVQGPASREILQQMTSADLSNETLPYYHFLTSIEMAGIEVQVSRIGFTGELGYEIILPVAQATRFWNVLFETGAPLGLKAAGAAAVMMCRIESGMIMAGLEYDHTMTPYECRMGWAVDLDGSDFQGKRALITAKNNPALSVVSVLLPGKGEYDGVKLISNGIEVGHVTMAVPSPYLGGQFVGLARISRSHSDVDSKLELASGGQAKIVPTPIYDPERVRVRS